MTRDLDDTQEPVVYTNHGWTRATGWSQLNSWGTIREMLERHRLTLPMRLSLLGS